VFLFGLAGIIILIGLFLKMAKRCGKYRKISEEEYQKLSESKLFLFLTW
jgi:hypothetical protein